MSNDKGETSKQNAIVFIRSGEDIINGVAPTQAVLEFINELITARDKGTEVKVEIEQLANDKPDAPVVMALRPVREQLTVDTLKSIK